MLAAENQTVVAAEVVQAEEAAKAASQVAAAAGAARADGVSLSAPVQSTGLLTQSKADKVAVQLDFGALKKFSEATEGISCDLSSDGEVDT